MNIRQLALSTALCSLSALFAVESSYAQAPPSAPETTVVEVAPLVAKHPDLASKSTEAVGTRMVVTYDSSASIDKKEFELQMESLALSIESDDFQDSIFFDGGPKSLAICFIEFGTKAELRIPWVDLRKGDDAKFKALGQMIRSTERLDSLSSSTNHATHLKLANQYLRLCPWEADKTIINVLTDGKTNGGSVENVVKFRDRLVKHHHATINALITLVKNEPDLEAWARKNLATPPGFTRKDGSAIDAGFTLPVATQIDAENPGATSKFEKKMEMAFRRSIFFEVASLDITSPYMLALNHK